jgi:hypothetical protein
MKIYDATGRLVRDFADDLRNQRFLVFFQKSLVNDLTNKDISL